MVGGMVIAILVFGILFVLLPYLADYHLMQSYTGNNYRDLEHCKRAIKLAPYRDFLYCHLAEIYLRIGEDEPSPEVYEQAIRNIRIAEQKNPKNPYNFLLGGMIFARGAQYINASFYLVAVRQYKKAIILFPNYPHAHFGLGKCYLEMGSFRKAQKEFQKTVTIDPHNSQAYFYLGYCYERLNTPEQAIKAYKRAVELDPSNVQAWEHLQTLVKN